MNNLELINCPICNLVKTNNILDLNCGSVDNTTLYSTLRINICEYCGHVYNKLTAEEIRGLMQYYDDEYAPSNLSVNDKTGDRPGSNSAFSTNRHNQLFKIIQSHINKNSKILDIGCAMGGFLDFLFQREFKLLSGIELSKKYVEVAQKKGIYNVKEGSADAIPFEDNSFELLVIDQVLEHLVDPKKAFKEANRVLGDNGLFCIGVPDASRYNNLYFFDFFWFLMREHIQHFDIKHLTLLAEQEGFELVCYNQNDTPIMSETMLLPNLNAVYRKTGKITKLNISNDCFNLMTQIKQYISDDNKRLNDKRKMVAELAKSQQPIYAWGIGREFLYMYEVAGLKKCNIVGLIDANPHKQKMLTVGGIKITDKSRLDNANNNSSILICATAYKVAIKQTLTEINYQGKILEL